MSDKVHEQYEAYPYPPRDPKDEAKRLITGSPSRLGEVNHYLFGGALDAARPLRVLVAGGGTGDGTVMLAQQLADWSPESRVVYLDLSTASRGIAEARAKARGLTNLQFFTGPLEAVAELGQGPYDYIDCCGVLHHLADPAAGLRALAAALAPSVRQGGVRQGGVRQGGGLGIMVYGEFGRSGVYPMQDMLRQLAGGRPLATQVDLAKRLLERLPASNLLRRNPVLGDYKRSDAELVDLFLHSRDRAYTVPQLAELVASADLEIVSLIEPIRYDPAAYLNDPALLEPLSKLSMVERAAFAEALAGSLKKHTAYLAPRGAAQARIARIEGPATRPVAGLVPGDKLAQSIRGKGRLEVTMDDLTIVRTFPPVAVDALGLVDGQRNLDAIHKALSSTHPGLDWLTFQDLFARLFDALAPFNLLWLENPSD